MLVVKEIYLLNGIGFSVECEYSHDGKTETGVVTLFWDYEEQVFSINEKWWNPDTTGDAEYRKKHYREKIVKANEWILVMERIASVSGEQVTTASPLVVYPSDAS